MAAASDVPPEVHENIDVVKEFWRMYYDQEVRTTITSDERSVHVDFDNFRAFDSTIARDTLENPDIGVQLLEESLYEYAEEQFGDVETVDTSGLERTKVRLYNIPSHSQIDISDIRQEHINRLRAIDAMVRNTTEPTTLVKEATFRCKKCGAGPMTVEQNTDEFTEPHQCESCERQGPFELIEQQSELRNYQKLQVQEPHDKQEVSTETRKKVVHVEEDLVDKVAPGDRVTVVGKIEAKPVSDGSPEFEYHIQANSIEVDDTTYEEIELDEEDREMIAELAEEDDIEGKIVDSIAPSIYGYDEEKRALAYQLFGGVPKVYRDDTRDRGDIHVLFAGDPGTAKSRLLNYMHDASPRSVKATGTDATKAGLTTAATKTDFGDGEKYELRAGVLPLADKGLACVDEFDKLSESQRKGLNDALEGEQQIDVNKAGLNAKLKSRASLLAAANPNQGRFDQYESIAEQIDMDPTVVSRFDLIFTFIDDPDEELDGKIADHMLSEARSAQQKHATGEYPEESGTEPEITKEQLRKYVAYAKTECRPVMTDEAHATLHDFYTSMRAAGQDDGPIPVTARELEALIRVSEARARMRLSDEITEEDAKRTIQLVNESLAQTIVDEDGNWDIDMQETGTSQAQKDRMETIKTRLGEMVHDSESGKVMHKELVDQLVSEGYDRDRIKSDIDRLLTKGEIIQPEEGMYREA